VKTRTIPAAQLLKLTGLVPSTSESGRLIAQGGAYLGVNLERIKSRDQAITVTEGMLLKVGKARVVRVNVG